MTDILVAGGEGRLGRALKTACSEDILTIGRAALDILNAESCAQALAARRPRLVINAAAMANVDACEHEPRRAFAINAHGAGVLAAACRDASIPLIHISTDFVFGGAEGGPWRESDAPAPVNHYGESKLAGERAVRNAHPDACIVRVAWLFGDGKDFPTRLLTHAHETGAAAAPTDQTGSPTPFAPLTQGLLKIARAMEAGHAVPPVLHLAGGPPASRYEWVQAAWRGAADAGVALPDLSPALSEAFKMAAARPTMSALDCRLAAACFGVAIDWRAAAHAIGARWAHGLNARSPREI